MKEDDWTDVQAIVLAPENRQHVVDVINRAKEIYQEFVGKGKHELLKNENPWNVPGKINYNSNFVRKDYKKSITQPYYARLKNSNLTLFEEDSDIEVEFIAYLEKAKSVKWWFKNGKADGTYFAVPYIENKQQYPFYVDFIVMFNDGKVGLFDTKGGIFAKTAKERAEGLARYIESENKKGKNLLGGIVLRVKNSWRLHNGKKYNYDLNDLKGWEFLNLD